MNSKSQSTSPIRREALFFVHLDYLDTNLAFNPSSVY